MKGAIPGRVWSEFSREMGKAWPRWGRAAARQCRQRLRRGELEGVPLVEGTGRTIGLALWRAYPRVGRQGEALFLVQGHRSLQSVRSQVEVAWAAGSGPLLSLPAPLPGIRWDVERTALADQGFRWVQRQRLSIDPCGLPRTPSPSGISLRPMRKGDQGSVLRLDLRSYRHHIDEAFGPGASVQRFGPGYIRGLFESQGPAIDLSASRIAEAPRGVVGHVLVMGQGSPRIQDLAVDPAYRGRGIGSCLLREALFHLAQRGVRQVRLGVTVGNPTGAYALYRKLGFRPDRTRAERMPGLWIHEGSRRRLQLALSEV